jgi:kynurenine formamidase
MAILFIACRSMPENLSTLQINGKSYQIDLDQPLDISLPVQSDAGVNAWYVDRAKIDYVEVDGYVGNVALGGSTNFNYVHFNPHSHGTHTECIGHITEEFHSVHDILKRQFFVAQLTSVKPEVQDNGDQVITVETLDWNSLSGAEAVVIRTMPNLENKKSVDYSNSNPPYLDAEVAQRFRESGINHLLIDLPSVDREQDEGKLAAHKEFWDFNGNRRHNATITELIYVPEKMEDGRYLLNLQVAPLVNNAAPSRPVLYKVQQ